MNTVTITKKDGSVLRLFPVFSCTWIGGQIIIQKQGILGGTDYEFVDDINVKSIEIIFS